jgi:hypothetical protein
MRIPARLLAATAVVVVVALTGASNAAATSWSVIVGPGSRGQATAQPLPVAPAGAAAACSSVIGTTVQVTWDAIPHATAYTVLHSTTSATAGFTPIATGVTSTSWTSGPLASGNHWFEVIAVIGTNWASPASAATAQRSIFLGFLCF